MSFLLLPADLRLKALAAQIEEERNHALEQGAGEEAPEIERERGESEQAFHALSSSAYADDLITSTIHGDDLQLFDAASELGAGTPSPAPAPAESEQPSFTRRE